MNHIKLGNIVKDAVTGYTGIAYNKTFYMNGNVQFLVQPEAKDNIYPDAISLDWHTLDVVSEGVAARAPEMTQDRNIELGTEVECMITGFKGTATMKTYYLNGCIAYLVQAKYNQSDKDKDGVWVDQSKLRILSKGVVEEYKKPEATKDGIVTGGAPVRNMFGKRGGL